MKSDKPKKFVAYKRTKNSSWNYDESNERNLESIYAIAPDAGHYSVIHLVEASALTDLQSKLDAARDAIQFVVDDVCKIPIEGAGYSLSEYTVNVVRETLAKIGEK